MTPRAARGAPMHENHQREQYFFDPATVEHLARFLTRFESPCCICAPMVGRAVARLGHPVTNLDLDERFAADPGFEAFDLYRPRWIERRFDVILCDPPFFNVSLSQLFQALRQLAHHDLEQKLVVAFLQRRAEAIRGTFAPFGLEGSGYEPGYLTVQESERNGIELFTNLDGLDLEALRSPEEA